MRQQASTKTAPIFEYLDWFLFFAALTISLVGLVTMRSLSSQSAFFEKQTIWICLSVGVFFLASIPSWRFLRSTQVIMLLYGAILASLALLFMFGSIVKGAQNRFSLGFFAIQPSDPAKLALVLLLSKYFARRHVEIAHIRHILVSGAYAFVAFVLIFLQPDMGSAIIICSVWLGLVLVSGISWKHLAALFLTGVVVFGALWQWGLHPYQKQRILTFVHPLADIRGSGYNAYQSMVAVGSGEFVGKGIGYGTQSKLRFLPEFETDFIFAAFAEEWGFVGVVLLTFLYVMLVLRILMIAAHTDEGFDRLVAVGVAIYFFAQYIVHTGMNLGLLPITGTTLPFMSYGGSHLLTEYAALGLLMGLRRRARPSIVARDETALFSSV